MFPLSFYKPDVYIYKLVDNYQTLKEGKLTEDELNLLPKDTVVFKRFEHTESVGCDHYICGCLQQCPICKKFYGCRQCHNDVEDHTLDRTHVTVVKCRKCGEEQPFGTKCVKCGFQFCSVHCDICKFMCFIDQNEKPFYHCSKCGTCRIGFPEDYIHCDRCNRCIAKVVFKDHRCRKNEDYCCVCLGSFEDTVFSITEMKCGH